MLCDCCIAPLHPPHGCCHTALLTGPPSSTFRAPPPPPPPLMGNLPPGMHPPPPPPRYILLIHVLHQQAFLIISHLPLPLLPSLLSCADQCITGCHLHHQEHLQASHLLLLLPLPLLCSHRLIVFSGYALTFTSIIVIQCKTTVHCV